MITGMGSSLGNLFPSLIERDSKVLVAVSVKEVGSSLEGIPFPHGGREAEGAASFLPLKQRKGGIGESGHLPQQVHGRLMKAQLLRPRQHLVLAPPFTVPHAPCRV